MRLTVTRGGKVTEPVEVLDRGGESWPIPLEGPRPAASGLETARRFLALGVTHIVPWGLDHVLFVLGLALLSPRFGPLLAQVTAFTVAHTLTLALSSYGVVRLAPHVPALEAAREAQVEDLARGVLIGAQVREVVVELVPRAVGAKERELQRLAAPPSSDTSPP